MFRALEVYSRSFDAISRQVTKSNSIQPLLRAIEKKRRYIKAHDRCGRTPIFLAAYVGCVSTIRMLAGYGYTNIDIRDTYGWTPMYIAAYNGHADAIVELALLGSRAVDIPMIEGCTPVFAAALNGHTLAFNTLAQLGCSVNVDRTGDSIMHHAVISGNCEIISALMHMGCTSINSPNKHGYTPMHKVIRGGRTEVVELLIQLGCTSMDVVAKEILKHSENKHNRKKILRLLRLLGLETQRTRANTVYRKFYDIMTTNVNEEKAAEVRNRVYFRRSLSSRLLLAYSRTLGSRASLIIKVEQDGVSLKYHVEREDAKIKIVENKSYDE